MDEKVVKDSQGLAKDLVNDCISRQAAIDALNKLDVSDGVGISSVACDLQEEAIHSIENLPSAQPERKRGRWEYVDYGGFGNWHCTVCGKICICNGDFDFCPNCGADMREVDE